MEGTPRESLGSGSATPVFASQSVNKSHDYQYQPYAETVIEEQNHASPDYSPLFCSSMYHVQNGSFVSSPRNLFSSGAHLVSRESPRNAVNESSIRIENGTRDDGNVNSSPIPTNCSKIQNPTFNASCECSKKLSRADDEKLQHEPYFQEEPVPDDRFLEKFIKSFCFGKKIISEMTDSNGFPSRQDNSKKDSYADTYYTLPIPYCESCTTKKDLGNDYPSALEIWYALRTANVIKYLLKAFRVMVFSVLPCFILIHLPATADWFTVGPLVPAIAASLTSDNVAEQLKLTLMIIQVILTLIPWGLVMEYTNMESNYIAWWFAVLVFPFVVGVMGNFQAKRMAMVYGVMMMEFSRQNPRNSPQFVIYFSIDLIIASLFALLSALLPFPVFAYRLADQQMVKMHHLYADALSKVVRSFWAPVLLEAEVARKQISWSEIAQERKFLEQLIQNIPYEPVEFGLKNVFRQQRLGYLAKIRWGLYSLAASSSLDNEFKKEALFISKSETVKKVQAKLSSIALDLTEEANRILIALGTSICPKEVLQVQFGPLESICANMEEVINSERDYTLLSKALTANETNSLLRLFAFHTTLLAAVSQLIHIEEWAMNYDKKAYPSWWMRLKTLLLGEHTLDWKGALTNRLLLATHEDVRVVKDSVRYALGLFVAVVFAHWNTNPENNMYYYGMGILSRLAQQTASETLQIGIMRICGLALGASFAQLIAIISSNLWFTVSLVFIFGVVCVTVSSHPSYGHVGQYALIVAVAVIPVSDTVSPEYILNRITANCFAFTGYLIVCLAVFPVDPIYVVSNYYVKILKTANDLTQLLIALGCCPITNGRKESAHLLDEATTLLVKQQKHLTEALQWNVTAGAEPTIRGIPYPMTAFSNLFVHLAELTSLQEGLLESMKLLHRPRLEEANLIIYAVLEAIRPFFIDSAKITHRFFQHCIDASEKPFEWSLTKAVGELWRAKLSIISLQRVTGHIQRSFIGTLLPHRRMSVNQNKGINYVPVEILESTGLNESFVNFSIQGSFGSMMNSFRVVLRKSLLDREDFSVFEESVVKFLLLISTLSSSFDYIVAIHKFELSRQQPPRAVLEKLQEESKKNK